MFGVIGGTGFYRLTELKDVTPKEVETPFGKPSAPLLIGQISGKKVAFLARHGASHDLLPSEVNYRANIWALKSIGVTKILGVSATGSLVDKIRPGEFAIPSQYFDFTKGRRFSTFFGEGLIAHISSAKPVCENLSKELYLLANKMDSPCHENVTYGCVEGPRLGTRAESFFLKNAGCHLVGMTNVPEAFLAREAQVCYATLAIATDYDCWKDDPNDHVSSDKVMALYKSTLNSVKTLVLKCIEESAFEECSCRESLKFSLISREESLTPEKKELLRVLKA